MRYTELKNLAMSDMKPFLDRGNRLSDLAMQGCVDPVGSRSFRQLPSLVFLLAFTLHLQAVLKDSLKEGAMLRI